MSPSIDMKIRWITAKLRDCIRDAEVPQPEEPGFAVGFNPIIGEWYAQLGENYAGFYDETAVVPVYLNKSFRTLEALLHHMEDVIRNAEEDQK